MLKIEIVFVSNCSVPVGMRVFRVSRSFYPGDRSQSTRSQSAWLIRCKRCLVGSLVRVSIHSRIRAFQATHTHRTDCIIEQSAWLAWLFHSLRGGLHRAAGDAVLPLARALSLARGHEALVERHAHGFFAVGAARALARGALGLARAAQTRGFLRADGAGGAGGGDDGAERQQREREALGDTQHG